MMFWSHQVVAISGFVTYVDVTTGGNFSIDFSFLWALALTMLGAAIPDIDHPGSTVGRRLSVVSKVLGSVVGHRGITHSLLASSILLLVGLNLQWPFMFWLCCGYLLHLVGDYLTDSGIPLLWPSPKRYRFVLVGTTGAASELVLVMLFIAACAATIWTF